MQSALTLERDGDIFVYGDDDGPDHNLKFVNLMERGFPANFKYDAKIARFLG